MFSSLDTLQFDALKALLERFAGSSAGRQLIGETLPHSDADLLRADLAEAAEAMQWVRDSNAGQLRFDQLRDIEPTLPVLQVEGSALDGRLILDLFATLQLAGEFRSVLLAARESFPLLAARGEALIDLRPLVRQYGRAFLPDGALSDDASVALRRIRRDIERQQRTITESLERFLRAHRDDGTLQEEFITIREDRYVVPVVAGQKGRVDGIIHGASGTGRTLFIEPLETVGLNNDLVRLRDDEHREVERILAEITGVLREHADEILSTAVTLAQLDVIFAKAAFTRSYDAVIPIFAEEPRRLELRKARHPLLETVLRTQRKPIIPISFGLDDHRRCLLISGPNTGGKTVTMKTTGLLALMAHAGWPVPAESAVFPVMDDVLADIGDQQSIAESLSSFSGHLLHVKQMLEQVTPRSLVLLDELGRATDPEEGGALGVAILDEFRKSGAFCLASTHLLPLKLYGTRTAGVLNASMGFDEATLQPTYVLRVGLPGKSAGLDIATRLALPQTVLSHARAVLPKLEADFQQLLAELQRQTDEHARATRELEAVTASLREREAAVERDGRKREEQRQREWQQKADAVIADFEARAQLMMHDVVGNLEGRKAVEQAQRQIAKTRREFREEAAAAVASAPVMSASVTAPQALAEGMRVRLRDIREPATVRRLLKNDLVEVEAGFLKMQVHRSDVLEIVPEKAAARERLKDVRVETGPRWDVSYRELNILGQRADEATEQVDKFLDSAALAAVGRVRIIHGHGMGVLKRAVSELLSKNPHVSRFYPAGSSEGGTGATIVELRE